MILNTRTAEYPKPRLSRWLRSHKLTTECGILADAGIFCAFSSRDLPDVATARFHIFAKPALTRDDANSLRVHLCPERPDQIEEMEFAESSSWGRSLRAGASKIVHLCQGSRFKIGFLGQEAELAWTGLRAEAEFTIPSTGQDGEHPATDDPDQREIFNGVVC